MNTQQMQYEFGIQMNQFDVPLQLSSDDIFYWLNKAQEHFVITRYNGANQLRKGFEQSQQIVDDLRALFKKDEYITASFLGQQNRAIYNYEAYYAPFKDDHLFLINQRSRIAYRYPEINFIIDGSQRIPIDTVPPQYVERVVSNRFSQSDDIFTLLNDPFNSTKATSPLTDVSDKGITVYTDKTFLVLGIIVSYIRRPKVLSLIEGGAGSYTTTESELPKHTHKEIIQLAVDLFLQNTRELKQRLQRETPTADREQNIEENE